MHQSKSKNQSGKHSRLTWIKFGKCLNGTKGGGLPAQEGNRTMQAKHAKRTAMKIVPLHDEQNQWTPTEKITCEVTGEMSNGAKVWTDVETGEQYFLTRMLGEYMFYHI